MNLFEALTGPARRVHHVHRFSSMPLQCSENVAEHSWHVAFICLLVGRDLMERGYTVDLEDLLERAIVHDLSEAMSGDIIRSFKYGTPEVAKAMREADHRNMVSLSRGLGTVGGEVLRAWYDAKLEYPGVGPIVSFADVVAVVIKCREEWHLGNRHMEEVLRRAYNDYLVPLCEEHKYLEHYLRQLFPVNMSHAIYRKTGIAVSEDDFKEGTHHGQ